MIRNLTSKTPGTLLVMVVLLVASTLPGAAERRDPEFATGLAPRALVSSGHFMVSAANPHAVDAGYAILEKGGNAVDAAIAIQMVLTLVEPQSSGIGGGAFMLYWDQKAGRLHSYDGRETAPQAADPDLFMEQGEPMDWFAALVGGRSVGVPGVLRMLEQVHRAHGRLPWKELFEHAIRLAEQGFRVSPRLHQLIVSGVNPGLGRYPAARAYFFPDGEALASGQWRDNLPLAESLRRIADQGATAFYHGDIARDMVSTVRGAAGNPGRLSLEDLAAYQARERPPVCAPYRAYRICGMGPPSSGAVTVLQLLSLLEGFPLSDIAPGSAEAIHLFTQAGRLAFADRERYLADTDFVPVPLQGLLDPVYLRQRRQLIDPEQDMGHAEAGRPTPGLHSVPGDAAEFPSTSHLSIVDGEGNAVAMTTSIEMAFGSTLMVRGFLLNNTLTDFSLSPQRDGLPVANRVEAGKRPRSSMAPTMVFDAQGRLVMVIGSPGGSRIISYVARTLSAVLDHGLDIQAAISQPNFSNRNGMTDLEAATSVTGVAETLELMGHQVNIRDLNSGLHGIVIGPAGLTGGADPRREGVVRGK